MLEAMWLYQFAMHMMSKTNMKFEECWEIGEVWVNNYEEWRHEDPELCALDEMSNWEN